LCITANLLADWPLRVNLVVPARRQVRGMSALVRKMG
jgi:hypothetical protein